MGVYVDVAVDLGLARWEEPEQARLGLLTLMANVRSDRCRTHRHSRRGLRQHGNWLWLTGFSASRSHKAADTALAGFPSQLSLGWRRLTLKLPPLLTESILVAVGPRAPRSRWRSAQAVGRGRPQRLRRPQLPAPRGSPARPPASSEPAWRGRDPGGSPCGSGVKKLPTHAGDWVGPGVWAGSRRRRAT